jgi:hypothetical protein
MVELRTQACWTPAPAAMVAAMSPLDVALPGLSGFLSVGRFIRHHDRLIVGLATNP